MAPDAHPFTCNTCQVAFRSSELQRTHMQSDWHRYNLKRRVASLPPLSSEVFADKVLASKANAAATAVRAAYEKTCDACQKKFYSENTYINHQASQKHRLNVMRTGEKARKDNDATSVISSTFSLGEPLDKTPVGATIGEEEEEEFSQIAKNLKDTTLENAPEPVSRRPTRPHHSAADDRAPHPLSRASTETAQTPPVMRDPLLECLFCTVSSPSLAENLDHMQKVHGMFIPEREFLVDAEGLITYLSSKVNEEYQCLYCNRLKWSESGIKTHMRDLSHCKIAFDSQKEQLEIGEYYDFRSTYSDDDYETEEDEDEAPSVGAKLGAKRVPKVEDGSSGQEGEDAGWETSSTVSDVPTEELGPVYCDGDRERLRDRLKTHPHHSHGQHRRHQSVDGYHSHAHPTPHAVYHDEFELHLPTGRVAGHRSLNRYFRQNLHNYPTPDERAQLALTEGDEESDEEPAPRGHDRGRQLVSRAEGGLGMVSVSEAKKREVRAVEKRSKKQQDRAQAKQQWRTDLKGNSQKHYRVSTTVILLESVANDVRTICSSELVALAMCGLCWMRSV
ncbi:hypothetical protein EJ06DRAFT_528199 [Trichodelitschia bisporula]|uniref:C2H2-type domain-containing protein n=1 Tax=Trichodelitschia bisporula TaxID=703511 RepID=A0A6G1I5I8_9PEZI|nr:hypothetical protein EJ06DRAFT_528199 [Trichodelitschia bisporula]